jgi:putative nucleotidyltransferase with HDIG domain
VTYAAAGVALSVAAFVYAFSLPRDASFHALLINTVVLAVLAVVAEELSVEFSNRMTLAASNLPVLLAIMLLGAAPALTVALVLGVWGCWRERSADLAVFNAANAVCSAFVAWAAFAAVQVLLGFPSGMFSWGLLVAGCAANVVHELTNMGAVSVGARLRYGRPVTLFWKHEMKPFLRSLVILTALGVTVGALYAKAGVGAVVLLFIPLFAAQYMFKLLVREKEHVARQEELSDQYLEMNIGLAAAMVELLDSKDEYTAQHSAAVAMYCRDMADSLQLPEADKQALHLAGLLHDLGKVGVPDAVLRKDTALEESEWDFIRQHPEKGAEVLSHLATYQDVADIVRYHHERLDGSGYPRGVVGADIPELSKILAVADSYHAMTSDRPYRGARSSFEALKELRGIAGVTLDRDYVEVLAGVLRDKDLAYRDGSSTDFMLEYERGRVNLRLRSRALAELSDPAEAQEDPAAG